MPSDERLLQRLDDLESELAHLRRQRSPTRRWASILVIGAATLTATAIAQPAMSALHVFNAGTPASARDVNQNFALVQAWMEQKLGAVNSENVAVPGTLGVTGATTTAQLVANGAGTFNAGAEITSGGLSVTGGAQVGGGGLTVNDQASFNQGGGTVVLQNGRMLMNDNAADYDLWIQGSTSSVGPGDTRNLALLGLSETNGDSLILNYGGEYASGVQVQSGMSVSGNVRGANNSWDDSSGWRAGVRKDPSNGNTVADGGTPNSGWAITSCPNGEYVCGIAFTHPGGDDFTFQEYVSIRCCGL